MKNYNRKVIEYYDLARVAQKGEVGIEIEVEGENLIHGGVPPFWHHHDDGSLRGKENAEYVLGKPVKRGDVDEALDNLFKALKGNGSKLRENSPNTSVHVHLNVQDWTIKQVYNLLVTWYIMEHTLCEWCGEDRIGNLFCLRGTDAELQLIRLASCCRRGNFNDLVDHEGLRYSALNYTSLGKFGSVEFRPLAGIYDKEIISTWVRALLSLKDFAEQFDNPTEIIQEFSRSGPEDFFKLVLKKDNLWKIFQSKDYKNQLHRGMRFVQNLAYCVAWEKETAADKKKGPESVNDFVMVDEFPELEMPRGRAGRPLLDPDFVRHQMEQVRRNVAQENVINILPQAAAPVMIPRWVFGVDGIPAGEEAVVGQGQDVAADPELQVREPEPDPRRGMMWLDLDTNEVINIEALNQRHRNVPLWDGREHPNERGVFWDAIDLRWVGRR